MDNYSITYKLKELFDLYKSGALTEEEYDLLKSKLIPDEETKKSDDVKISPIESSTTGKKEVESSTLTESIPAPILINKNNEQNTTSNDKIISKNFNNIPKKKINTIIGISTGIFIIIITVFLMVNRKSTEWSERTATKIIMNELSQYQWSDKIDRNYLKHTIIGFTEINSKNKVLKVALIETLTGDDYRHFSVFEFENQNGWKLKNRNILFESLSRNDVISIIQIAPDNWGILKGETYEDLPYVYILHQMYAFINGEFKQIFSISNRRPFKNQVPDLNHFKPNFIKKSYGYYDIEAFASLLPTGQYITYDKKMIFKFNGVEYVGQQ